MILLFDARAPGLRPRARGERVAELHRQPREQPDGH